MPLRTITFITCFSFSVFAHAFLPEKGVLADEASAIRVAEAVLSGIYGTKIAEQRPFTAKLNGESWVVEGTLKCAKGKNCKGGVAKIEMNKADARVVDVSHGK